MALAPQALDRLMPMHLRADDRGRVVSAGPTLRRLLGGADPAGRPVAEIVRLRRSGNDCVMAAQTGVPLHVELLVPEPVRLAGVAVRGQDGTLLLDLSFGIGLVEAVRRWGLRRDDFAATDLAAELLYLAEANAAALAEARRLADRLDAATAEARRDAATDALTGLANRRALERAVQRLAAAGTAFALLSIDLDRFKAVNDAWGHEAGDAVLRAVAGRISAAARSDDLAVRLGGDEFALLLRGAASEARLLEIAGDLIRTIEQPVPLPPGNGAAARADPARVSASVGIVRTGGTRTDTLAALLRQADDSLYRAKRAGRGHAVAQASGRRPSQTVRATN